MHSMTNGECGGPARIYRRVGVCSLLNLPVDVGVASFCKRSLRLQVQTARGRGGTCGYGSIPGPGLEIIRLGPNFIQSLKVKPGEDFWKVDL